MKWVAITFLLTGVSMLGLLLYFFIHSEDNGDFDE